MQENARRWRMVLGVLLVAVTGCSTMNTVSKMPSDVDARVKNLAPPAGMSLVYVVRPTMLGFPFGGTVTANDELVGVTQGGIFVYAVLPPGDYKFKVTGHDNDGELTAKLDADRTYYVYQSLYTGLFRGITSLELVSTEKGREAISQCSLGNKLGTHVVP